MAPTWAQNGFKLVQDLRLGPEMPAETLLDPLLTPQDGPSRPNLAPTWPQDSPKLAPNWHQNPPQNRLLRRSPLQRPICQRFWPNVGAFGGSICGHFGASLEGFSSLVFVLVTFLPVQDRLAPPREMPTICSSSSWLRRAAAIAKRLGSAARHHVAASAFRTRPRLVQAGTKVDRRCRRHRRSNF